ncbi:LamG-like jellyroll fold domain-containing protein [Marinoscillum pacificum]|uniref:LamG-like jellyroll fold domain-containing protein n=1 Tax=Marinoscillum pacificum TaxID=392723 RepID=UPI0021578914|nr:LamG-like jellyroll fold domain-containing protein [Marinoscillum pacificum]
MKFPKLLSGWKQFSLLACVGCLVHLTSYAQTVSPPQAIGYTSGQSVQVNDTLSVSYFGGSIFKDTSNTAFIDGTVITGFPYILRFAPNAFDEDLFVSKGYYPEYVQLSWELIRFQDEVSYFRIYRKLLSEADTEYTQVATVSTDATSWRDEFAEAGVMYEYKLKAEGLYAFEENFKNTLEGVGFRLPSGSVSGRVTFVDEGGAPVEGVTIIAETDDSFNSTSVLLNGTSSYLGISPETDHADFKFEEEFTFQAWVKPDATANYPATIFQKGNQYKITHTASGQVTFAVENAANSITLNFTEKAGEFFNISAVRTADDSLKLYVMYEDDEIFKTSSLIAGLTTTPNNNEVFIGQSEGGSNFFKGHLDEIRIWKKARTDAQIRVKTFQIISGTETGLSAYYRLNEATGDYFYDLSRQGFNFHEQHGSVFNITWSTEVPTATQLAVKGITDSNGNYLVSGIPYTSDGSLYTLTPAFGTHKFSPTQASRFIGPGSSTFSGVNFVDKSSFSVTGYVFYSNTKFPVSGVQIAVDGVAAIASGGSPVVTDGNGFFSLEVPIGEHRLQLVKNGHVFEGDGYFPSPDTFFDFQTDFNIDPSFFRDSTLIKVIGKVVGGPVEGEKPTGLGQSVNNIGNASFALEPQKPYDLKEQAADSSGVWAMQYVHEGDTVEYETTATTGYEILNTYNSRRITIEADSKTGEFTAYLLPERYSLKSLEAGDYISSDFGNLVGATWDLTNVFSLKTEIDSAYLDPSDPEAGYAYDSIQYNFMQNLVLRVNPTVSVTSKDSSVPRFWDDVVTVGESEISVVSGDDYGDWNTAAPIFTQRKKYEVLVSVFEEYVNVDNSNASDQVPVVDGEVQIQNALANKSARRTFSLDENGEVLYDFLGGIPNTASAGADSYMKTFSLTVYSGKGGAITTEWLPGGSTFKGYVLGGKPVGNNFVTSGPNVVSMILRDPHGSNSYSYYETGTTNTTEMSLAASSKEASSLKGTVQMGAKVTVNTGVPGATVQNEVKIEANESIGLEQSLEWADNNTVTHSVTNTQRWSTSDSPDFVGSNGDVFIGNATNIVYGNSLFIELIEESAWDGTEVDPMISFGGTNYKIGQQNALRMNPEFSTAFQYTQNHIEGFLLPDLKFLRNEYLKSAVISGTYSTSLSPTDSGYGEANTTETRSSTGITGDSYSITYPAGYGPGTDDEFVDSVAYYNNQIQSWKNILARNEREKLESTVITNYSYDAGVVFESSATVEESKVRTETFEFSVSPNIARSAGIEVNGVGAKVEFSMSFEHRETESSTTGNITTQTFGYVLSDSDEGDYYSMDVRDPGSRTGPVFKVRGGQSMCPYVGEEQTKYYTPGATLSEATLQREVPQLLVENAIISDVLEGKSANFKLSLSNVSDSGDPAWYQLSIDESSVSGGLVEIDGASLKDGRVFFIPAGSTLKKTLSISQVDPNITEFEDVTVILHSLCQFDPTSPWPTIADSVSVTARFQPACSDVEITSPDDLWLVNTSQIVYSGNDISSIPITVGLAGYDLTHSSFETIAVQYKATSSSQWLTDMVYYVDATQFNAAPEPKTFVNNLANLSYILETKDLPDRTYDVRLKTTCSDGTENFSETRSGIKDVKRPLQFGTPQPGDGILSPGEDIMLTLDEDIEAGILTLFNFSVKGVLNGQPIDHNSVLFFDGIDDNATVVEGVKLTDKSFTIEFWTEKLTDNTNGVIYSQGDIELGFNSSNNFYAKLGTSTFTTTDTYTSSDNWMHWAVVYDYTDKEVAFYMNDEIALNKTTVSGDFEGSGRVYFGQSKAGSNFYHGYVHDVRVWEASKGQGAIVANMSTTLRGDEVGLSGLWPMNEARSLTAYDLSRNHNAVLNGADWRVFPVGYAWPFDGTNTVSLPSGTLPISNSMDMTFEFWMKASAQSNTVMFSNGRGNGDDSTPPFANIWVVGANANGKLYVQNNGVNLVVTPDVFDNNWHHVAVVLKRIANTTVYVDGNQAAFTSSSNVGGFTGAQFALGARQFYSGGTYSYDRHFTGRIDEFRLWKLARTKEQLELDRNAALKGDEIGLMAYLPFDDYDINQILQPSLASNTPEDDLTATASSGSADNSDVPNLKEPRPVQNVGFNWVVNEDQIILNLTDDPSVIEKTVLEITVQNIEDLNQNRLASPITWTAYVNKNTVLWDEQVVNLEKLLYEELTFSVDILNLGGTEQTYEISNIPSWLDIDQPTGNLLPNSSKTLRFTVKEATNIGEYEHSLYLSSDFGFQEKFDINLRVYQEAPDWAVDPESFEYGMSVIGVLDVNGIMSTDPNDMIAAHYGGEIRGVANLEYVAAYDKYIFFMDVYSNKSNGETLDFKVWNADEGKIHVNVSPQLDFLNNNVVGSPSSPQVFTVRDEILVTYNMKQGWNWISFNVTAVNMVNSNQIFGGLTLTEGDLIKTIDKFDQYGMETGWIGEVTNQGGLDVYTGYKMKLGAAQSFNISGTQVKVDTVEIPLVTGWNWIGYPSSLNMEVNTALGNMNFTNNDFIKGQNGFALYDDKLGWIGSLEFMVPTKGYMLQVASPGTLTFPDPALLRTDNNVTSEPISAPEGWNVDVYNFAKSMSIVAQVNLCESSSRAGDYLGVFVNGECRGYTPIYENADLDNGLFFLTAHAETNEETLEFKYFSADLGEAFALDRKEVFVSDALKGTVNEPISLTMTDEKACARILAAQLEKAGVSIYPNPFESGLNIQLNANASLPLKLQFTDLAGRLVDEATVTSKKYVWDGRSSTGALLPDGIYMVLLDNGVEQFRFRVIKETK